MNTNFIKASVLAVVFSLSQISMPALACPFKHHFEKLSHKLNLNDEQRTKIKQILDQDRPQVKAKRQELHDLRAKINNAFQAGDVTAAKIDDFVSQEKDILGALIKIRLTERQEISHVLTTEQKTKLHEMIQKHKEERRHRFEHEHHDHDHDDDHDHDHDSDHADD